MAVAAEIPVVDQTLHGATADRLLEAELDPVTTKRRGGESDHEFGVDHAVQRGHRHRAVVVGLIDDEQIDLGRTAVEHRDQRHVDAQAELGILAFGLPEKLVATSAPTDLKTELTLQERRADQSHKGLARTRRRLEQDRPAAPCPSTASNDRRLCSIEVVPFPRTAQVPQALVNQFALVRTRGHRHRGRDRSPGLRRIEDGAAMGVVHGWGEMRGLAWRLAWRLVRRLGW